MKRRLIVSGKIRRSRIIRIQGLVEATTATDDQEVFSLHTEPLEIVGMPRQEEQALFRLDKGWYKVLFYGS